MTLGYTDFGENQFSISQLPCLLLPQNGISVSRVYLTRTNPETASVKPPEPLLYIGLHGRYVRSRRYIQRHWNLDRGPKGKTRTDELIIMNEIQYVTEC